MDLTRPTNSVPSPSASISPVVLGSARTTPFFKNKNKKSKDETQLFELSFRVQPLRAAIEG